MGGATKRSFISAYFLLSAYFLTAQTYKRMRLTTKSTVFQSFGLSDEDKKKYETVKSKFDSNVGMSLIL